MAFSWQKTRDLLMQTQVQLAGRSPEEPGTQCVAPNATRLVDYDFSDYGQRHRKGLAPDTGRLTQKTPDQLRETYLHIYPTPLLGQVGVAGFDLRVGTIIGKTNVIDRGVKESDLRDMEHTVLQPGQEFVFYPDENGKNIYYIASYEQIEHSYDLEFAVDSKSTLGRVGGMTHGLKHTNGGHLITILQPYSFPLKVTCGKTCVSQVVVRYKDTPYLNSADQIRQNGQVNISGNEKTLENSLTPQGLLFTFSTHRAYRAKKLKDLVDVEPIDMDARKTLNWRNYFDLEEGNSKLTLDSETLYLLGSQGLISLGAVCGILSREQDALTGTGAWAHFAGIIQPFWMGGITMEWRSTTSTVLHEGENAGVARFDEIQIAEEEDFQRPEQVGSYHGQEPPMLPKMFNLAA